MRMLHLWLQEGTKPVWATVHLWLQGYQTCMGYSQDVASVVARVPNLYGLQSGCCICGCKGAKPVWVTVRMLHLWLQEGTKPVWGYSQDVASVVARVLNLYW